MGLETLLLKRKPAAIMICLKDSSQAWYPSKLAKYSGASYVYTTNWLSKLEKAGWVEFEKKGKLKIARLTEKGAVIASLIDEVSKKMGEQKQKESGRAGLNSPELN